MRFLQDSVTRQPEKKGGKKCNYEQNDDQHVHLLSPLLVLVVQQLQEAQWSPANEEDFISQHGLLYTNAVLTKPITSFRKKNIMKIKYNEELIILNNNNTDGGRVAILFLFVDDL